MEWHFRNDPVSSTHLDVYKRQGGRISVEETTGPAKNRAAHIGGPAAGAGGGAAAVSYTHLDVYKRQLQDSHWAGGSIGYFPSYAIGSAYGAQYLLEMQKDFDVGKIRSKRMTGIFDSTETCSRVSCSCVAKGCAASISSFM